MQYAKVFASIFEIVSQYINQMMWDFLTFIYLYIQRSKEMKIKILLVLFLTLSAVAFALPDPGGGEFPCGGEFGPCPIPIDGGVGILLASGIALGGAKWLKEKRNQQQ